MTSGGRTTYNGAYQYTRRQWFKQLARQHGPLYPCHLCGNLVDITQGGRGPWARSIDHTTPIARGGDINNPAEWQVAHIRCNSIRGAKLPPSRPAPPPSRDW